MMQNQVFAARARASRPTLVLLLMLALAGCDSSGDESDDSGVALDASSPVDARPDATSAERETGTAQEDAAANTSACVPGCEATALCCVDAHGHLPRCVAEAVCPSGFKPAGN